MKLGGGVGALYKNLNRVRIWGHRPWVRTPKNVAVGYDVEKINTGCPVCLCVGLFVCLFVKHDNFRTSKHRMMKLGVGALYKNFGLVRIWGVIARPLGAHLQKCGIRLYDVGKISPGCLVLHLSKLEAIRPN